MFLTTYFNITNVLSITSSYILQSILFFFCILYFVSFFFFFFFQAEDGIRDRDVTGVQTCALPIYRLQARSPPNCEMTGFPRSLGGTDDSDNRRSVRPQRRYGTGPSPSRSATENRSEERRVGKECRKQLCPHNEKKKQEITEDERKQ